MPDFITFFGAASAVFITAVSLLFIWGGRRLKSKIKRGTRGPH